MDLFSEIPVTDRAAEAYRYGDSTRPAGFPLAQAVVSGGAAVTPFQLWQSRLGAIQLRFGLKCHQAMQDSSGVGASP